MNDLWVGSGITNGVSKMMVRAFNGFLGILKKLQPYIERVIRFLLNGVQKAMDLVSRISAFIGRLVNKVGGIEKALKLVGIAAGAVWLALNAGKVLDFLKKAKNLLSVVHSKVFAMAAAVVMLALLIEDLISFMQGNDSVIGALFEKAGIDADGMRQKIKAILGNLEAFFNGLWNAMKEAAAPILEAIRRMLENVFGEELFVGLGKGIAGVIGFLERITAALAGNTGLQEFLGKAVVAVIAVVTALKGAVPVVRKVFSIFKLVSGAVKGAGAAIGLLTSPIGIVVAAIAALIAIGILLYKNWDNAREIILKVWDTVKNFLLDVWDFIKQAAGMFADTIKGFFERHGESIRANFERVWGIIKTFLNGVWTFISQLAATLFGSTEDSIDESTTSTKDKLLSVWQSILDALSAVWDALYEAGSAIFNAIATVIETVFGWIQTFWNAWGSRILSWFKTLWNSIGGILNGFLEIIKGVANFISSVFTGDWKGAWDAIKQIFTGIWVVIVNFITAVWDTIKMLFEMALAAIRAIWEKIWNGIKSFFEGIWNGIVSFVSGIWDAITGIISGAINGIYNVVVSILTAIKNFFSNIFGGIADSVGNIFSNILGGIIGTIGNIKDAIVGGLTTAIDWVKGIPSQALQWGKDIVGGIADGVKGAIGKVTDAVSGVASKIKSFLHFSVPDEGPLTDYEDWMPDFMGGLAKGIQGSEDTFLSKVRSVAGSISALMQGATVRASTVANGAVNSMSHTTVTQNNTFNNSYSGSDMQAQQNVSKGMNKSAQDATSYMAKGLAYAR